MTTKRTYIKFVTPKGYARWPKLHKKDVYQGNETKYTMGILFDEAEWAKVKDGIKDARGKCFPSGKKPKGLPLKKDPKTGETYLHCSSHKKVPLFRKRGDKLPEKTILGGGSEIITSLTFTEANGYLVAWIEAVLVKKLVTFGESNGSEFGDEGFDEDDDDLNASSDDSDDDGFDTEDDTDEMDEDEDDTNASDDELDI
jgi:hypothetical protein